MEILNLRYGMNPHQSNARIYSNEKLPFKILNGEPSYINLLDAFNAYQLAQELRRCIGQPAAASFKHVSPSGAAVYSPLDEPLIKSYFIEGMELSPLAVAYARARGADRMSSFGDCAAFSDPVDITVANLLSKEVSDCIVAPGFDKDALAVLKKKKNGGYIIIEADPDYMPEVMEARTVFGMTMEQQRNDLLLSENTLKNIVTTEQIIPEEAKRDMLLALITLKYTQSNSVCFAHDGQTIGIGSGQQSRIHCTRLAAEKADNWQLRQHPIAQEMVFCAGVSRAEINNAIDGWMNEDMTSSDEMRWRLYFDQIPARLTKVERQQWLAGLKEVVYASDACLPFRDNIDRAAQSGVKYVVQTGHSLRDNQVIEAANEYGMVMVYSGIRLFHH